MRIGRAWAQPVALFALAAWPAWIVPVPPLQDLPNHLATAYVQLHPDRYPELVSNGFLKTNSTLFLFLHVAAHFVSLRLAAKIFVTLVALVGAIAYPAAAWRLGRNERAAAFVLWPMVHNWFVAMGMLDYALAVPLTLLALVALAENRRAPSMTRASAAAIAALAIWYTHAFAVVVLAVLVGLELVATRKWRDARTLVAPLVPAVGLTAWSALLQLFGEKSGAAPLTTYAGAPALFYGAFSEWLWSLSRWTLASLVACAVLVFYGVRRFRERPAFFSPLAMIVLAAAYLLVPSHAAHWFYVGSRFLPFLWMGCALRVPEQLPAWLERGLAAAAVAFSIGLGVEYTRLSADWRDFERGEQAVPEGSRLLPLIFDRKGPHGENTWPMLHAWGLYVVDRGTSAPLLFAHSPSFPVTYAKDPPKRFHGIPLEELPRTMRSPATLCSALERSGLVPDSCESTYRAIWDEFWRDAAPRFDRVLVYGATADARAAIPPTFRVLYDADETLVLATSSP